MRDTRVDLSSGIVALVLLGGAVGFALLQRTQEATAAPMNFPDGRAAGRETYRAECASHARALGIGGFVRNLPDGRVEAAFEGDPNVVEWMIRWCREGPPLARVDHVEVTEESPVGDREFRVTR